MRRVQREDGVWLELPARQVQPMLSWGLVVFGIACSVFMMFWIGGAAGWNFNWRHGAIPRLVFASLGLPGLAVTVAMVVIGIGLARGWSTCGIGIGASNLLVRERIGWLSWTWRVAIADLRGIVHDIQPRRLAARTLLIRRSGRRDLFVAPGYPAEALQDLALAMQRELSFSVQSVPIVGAPGLGPPPGNIEVEEADGRIAIAIPIPMHSRPWPVLVFAVVWLGIVSYLSLRVLDDPSSSWTVGLFLLPFWAIGIGLIIGFIHFGWRQVSMLWDGSRLTLVDASPMRRRIRSWEREEIAEILAVDRGSDSGRYLVVTVKQRSGKEHDLTGSLDSGAQTWIATRLRAAVAPAPAESEVSLEAAAKA